MMRAGKAWNADLSGSGDDGPVVGSDILYTIVRIGTDDVEYLTNFLREKLAGR